LSPDRHITCVQFSYLPGTFGAAVRAWRENSQAGCATLAGAIEDYRFANRLKTEAEAIRQLLELGLKAAGASKPASLG
jgi:hypothetical protein